MASWLSRRRLLAAWQHARAQPDPAAAVASLREVRDGLREDPDGSAHRWLEIAQDFVAPGRLELLTEADFAAFDDMADVLAQFLDAPVADLDQLIVDARTDRAEEPAARAALAALHDRQDAEPSQRRSAAVELARRGAREDRALSIYAEHLRDAGGSPAPEVRAAVEAVLDVDLSTAARQLDRAAALVAELGHAAAGIPRAARALGLHALLAREDPAAAAVELELAVRLAPGDAVSRALLAVALLAAGDARGALAQLDAAPDDRRGVRPLAEVVRWLDDVSAQIPRPAIAAADLLGCGVPACLVRTRDGAAGRLLLVEGAAREAGPLLASLVEHCPQEPRWRYFAAWAQLLTDGRVGDSIADGGAGGWAMASLLGVEPAGRGLTAEQASVIAARLALAAGNEPPPLQWQPGGGTAEEELEAVRVAFAVALRARDVEAARAARSRAPFARLPLADQEHWHGLLALAEGRNYGGVRLLRNACRRGSPHAPVALCAHHLQTGATAAARELLDGPLALRDEPHVALLRACASAAEGRYDAARSGLALLAGEVAAAGYALADVCAAEALASARQGERDAAAALWREGAAVAETALAGASASAHELPSDARTLAAALRFAADPNGDHARALRPDRAVGARREWIAWYGAVARLWTERTPAAVEAGEALVGRIEAAPPQLPAEAPVAIAEQLAKLVRDARTGGDPQLAERALALLDRLVAQTANAEIAFARRMAAGEQCADGASMLVAVRDALARGDRAHGTQLLQEVRCGDDRVDRACATLVMVLAGGEPPSPADQPQFRGGPWSALHALAAFAAGNAERGSETILRALREDPEQVRPIVRVDALLEPLCARSARGPVPAGLLDAVQRLAHSATSPAEAAAAARCAATLGASDIALTAWGRAQWLNGAEPEIADEHAGYLRHLAALDVNRGDELAGAARLQLADSVVAGGRS